MPRLTPAQVIQLRDALAQGFDRGEFEELVELFSGKPLDHIAAPVALDRQIREVIHWAERRGATVDLLLKASQLRPHNRDLLDLAATLKAHLIQEAGATLSPDEAPALFKQQLQRVLRPELPYADVVTWSRKLNHTIDAVCRVELTQGAGAGSGFLVANNLALTCFHVIEDLLKGGDVREAVLRFDFKLNPDGQPIHDREYRLRPDWLAASSPTEELDYALLRIQGDPGNDQTGDAEHSHTRGYLKLSPAAPSPGHPVQIVQHPRTLPMKLAFGAIAPASSPTVAYTVNADPGSSGSPVADAKWNIIALHGLGGDQTNSGISSRAILQDLASKNLSSLLA